MSIEGLRSPDQASAEVPAFNPNDRAELALAVVEVLSRVEDRDKFLGRRSGRPKGSGGPRYKRRDGSLPAFRQSFYA